MASDSSSKIQQESFQTFVNEARLLREQCILTDFTLECEGDLFPVHRMILAASSPFFRDYFIQTGNSKEKTMSIDFMQSKVLQIILDYFYNRRIILKEEDSPELLKNLLEALLQLQITLLYDFCLELLLKKSSNDISFSDWLVVEALKSYKINKIFLTHILKKSSPFSESETFLQCTFNQVITLFFGPEGANCDQCVILQCIVNWVKYDVNGRKTYLSTFLEKLDFERITATNLSVFQDEDLLLENNYFLRICTIKLFKKRECNNEELNSMEIKKISAVKPQLVESQFKSQTDCDNSFKSSVKFDLLNSDFRSLGCKFFIFGVSEDYQGKQIFMYDYRTDVIERMIAHPLFSINVSSTVLYKDRIYSFSGENVRYRLVYVYSITDKQWSERQLLGVRRSTSTSVELNGYIYTAGGYLNATGAVGKFVECYDPESNESKYVASLPAVNKHTTVPMVSLDGCLYAWLKTHLYKYLPKQDKWYLEDCELNSKVQTEDIHWATGNNKIFMIKKLEPNTVWIYDPEDNTVCEDFVPSIMKECDGIITLDCPESMKYAEFLVSGSGNWFLYTPFLHSWVPVDLKKMKDFKISMLTLLSRDCL